eukprot:12129423-Ditylum_brightwellii.AAC.1
MDLSTKKSIDALTRPLKDLKSRPDVSAGPPSGNTDPDKPTFVRKICYHMAYQHKLSTDESGPQRCSYTGQLDGQ